MAGGGLACGASSGRSSRVVARRRRELTPELGAGGSPAAGAPGGGSRRRKLEGVHTGRRSRMEIGTVGKSESASAFEILGSIVAN